MDPLPLAEDYLAPCGKIISLKNLPVREKTYQLHEGFLPFLSEEVQVGLVLEDNLARRNVADCRLLGPFGRTLWKTASRHLTTTKDPTDSFCRSIRNPEVWTIVQKHFQSKTNRDKLAKLVVFNCPEDSTEKEITHHILQLLPNPLLLHQVIRRQNISFLWVEPEAVERLIGETWLPYGRLLTIEISRESPHLSKPATLPPIPPVCYQEQAGLQYLQSQGIHLGKLTETISIGTVYPAGAQKPSESLTGLLAFTPAKAVEWAAITLSSYGWVAVIPKKLKAAGADIIAFKGRRRRVVQMLRHQPHNPVSYNEFTKTMGCALLWEADEAMLITTGCFAGSVPNVLPEHAHQKLILLSSQNANPSEEAEVAWL